MELIEFKTVIKHGSIKIPKKYRENMPDSKLVKVILYSDTKEQKEDFIEKLLKKPVEKKDFKPFSREEIYERNL